METEGNA